MTLAHRVLAALSLSATAIGAQTPSVIPDVRIGDRVRVESPEVRTIRVIGPLVQANQGFVTVALGDDFDASMVVPWARITAFDVAGSRQRKERAGRGALVGFGVALLAAPPLWDHRIGGEAELNWGAIASIGLPATGALIGWLAAPPKWQMIDWRPKIDTVLPEGEAIRLNVPAGKRVTVRFNRRTFGARIVSTADSLIVRRRSEVRTFAWDNVTELKMQGHRDRWRGAAVGLSVMGLYSGFYVQSHSLVRRASPAEFVVQRLAIGGLIGAVIGTRGWTRVPVPKSGR